MALDDGGTAATMTAGLPLPRWIRRPTKSCTRCFRPSGMQYGPMFCSRSLIPGTRDGECLVPASRPSPMTVVGRDEPVKATSETRHSEVVPAPRMSAVGSQGHRLHTARSSPSRMSALGRSGWLQGASLQAAICQGHRCDALCRDAGALAWTELEAQEIVRAFASTSVVSIARSWCILRPCGARSF